MDVGFSAEERMLLEAFREHLAEVPDQRAAMESGALDRPALAPVAALLADGGWFALADKRDATACKFTLIAGLAEEAGRRIIPLAFPLIESWALLQMTTPESLDPAVAAVVDGVNEGRTIAALATDRVTMPWTFGEEPCTAAVTPYGAWSDVVIVPATDGSSEGLLLAEGAGRTSAKACPELDVSAPAFGLELDPGKAVFFALGGGAHARLRSMLYCLQGATLVGQAQAVFDRTLEYAKQRRQFGVHIGGFQAIKHRLADLYCQLETARSLVYYASWTTQEGEADFERFAACCKAFAAEMAFTTANEAIQLHGGLGFTWDGLLHFPARRIAQLSIAVATPRECYRFAGDDLLSSRELWGS